MKTFHLSYFLLLTAFFLLAGCKNDPVSTDKLPQILYGQVVDSQGNAIADVNVHYIFQITDHYSAKIENHDSALSKVGKICPSTDISFTIPKRSKVTVKLFRWYTRDIVGTMINDTLDGGTHSITLDAAKITNGFYIYQLQVDTSIVEKMLVYINLDVSTLVLTDPLTKSNSSGVFELPYALLGFGVPNPRTGVNGQIIDTVQISSTFQIVLYKTGYSTTMKTVTIDPAVGIKQTFVLNKH
jgi:hypothetical protein